MRTTSTMKFIRIGVFLIILLIATIFRFTGINWDDSAHLHPDERFLTMVATDISWPQSLTQYFDTNTSPMNPHNVGHGFYVYGTYPVHLVKFIAYLFHRSTYDGITIIGRYASGITELLTVVFVFLIAKRLASEKAALIAMFLYASMVLPIQLSHFFTVDPYVTLFCTIALYLLTKKRFGVALGIVFGLAISAKISSILLLPIFVIEMIKDAPWRLRGSALQTYIKSLVLFIASLLITTRIFYPYLFDGWHINKLVIDNWKSLKSFDGVNTTFPPALQWINVPAWKPAWDMFIHGLGLPLGILASISVIYHLIRIKKTNTSTLVFWILIVLGYQSLQFAKTMRYLYPIYPALAATVGIVLARIRFSFLLTLPVLLSLLIWPVAFTSIYRKPHTRISASDWVYANINSGKTIAWEHWDDPLPLGRGTNHIGKYQTIQLPMYDPDTPDKWQQLTGKLAMTDYIILSSNRVYGGVSHALARYPYTNRYYRLLFTGGLGFKRVAEFTSRPGLFSLEWNDDNAEESFTVYDHPKVMIFQNIIKLDAQQLYERIYE